VALLRSSTKTDSDGRGKLFLAERRLLRQQTRDNRKSNAASADRREHGSSQLRPGTLWRQYDRIQQRFLDAQAAAYDAADPERQGPSLDFVWDGDGHNPNAFLTVFRHFDNARA
jgi:hypothetical protein